MSEIDTSIFLIVPCFNEEKRMDIEKFRKLLRQYENLEIVFVDDGSSDATPKIMSEFQKEFENATAIRLSENIGKANALRFGMNHVITLMNNNIESSWIGFTDSDAQISFVDVASALEKVWENSNVDEVHSVFATRPRSLETPRFRKIVGLLIARFLRLGFKMDLPEDSQCGLKFFRLNKLLEESIQQKFETKWFFELELCLRFIRASFYPKVLEIPLTSLGDSVDSKVRLSSVVSIMRELLHIKWLQLNILLGIYSLRSGKSCKD
jgi:dolichyl-phosphate beta-glucosyltransferase